MKKINIYFITIIIFLLLFLAASYYYNKFETFSDDKNFGFIVTRHVNSENSDKIWKKCITQIRQFYPDQKIVIIDDNSNYDFIDNNDVDLNNCIIIDSEFKKRGELLPYYYYYKNKWFDRAVFIHDSVFINNKLKLDNINDVKFIWHFTGEEGPHREEVKQLLSVLNHKDELLTLCYKTENWIGCWGTMSVIDYDFLKKITEKYNMIELINHVEGRTHRCAMEQVFALICINEKPELLEEKSIYGYYTDNSNNRKSGSYDLIQYEEDVKNGTMTADINKLFFGR